MVVLDASVALSWVLPGEQSPQSTAILKRLIADDEVLVVPAIWPQEVANAVWVNLVRRGRIDSTQARQALEDLTDLDVSVEPSNPRNCFGYTFPLAVQNGLTVYDASYLDVALKLGCPILTDDDRVGAVASVLGIPRYGDQ